MEYTSLNPFVPNVSVFRRPDGVFELYLHLPGIISDLEVTPFASYLLVSGRHYLPGYQSEDGREAELVWSDQPCGYFGRDIQLGMNNAATELILLESSSCRGDHAVVRFSIRQKEVCAVSCGEVMHKGDLSSSGIVRGSHVTPSTAHDAENPSHSTLWPSISHDASVRSNVGQVPVKSCPLHQPLPNSAATRDNLRRHVTFDAPHNTFANGTGVYELPTSNQELPVPSVLSNEQAPQNPVPVAPGDTSSNTHGASHFRTDFNDYRSSKPVRLPTDQTPVPIRFPGEYASHNENLTGNRALDVSEAVVAGGGTVAHAEPGISTASTSNVNKSGDHPSMTSGEVLTLPARNVAFVKELMRQKIMKDSGDGGSGTVRNNNPDITDGPSGVTVAGSSDEKVLASSSQRESGSVPVNVPDSLQEGLPKNGGRQSSAATADPTQTNIPSTEESAEHKVEFSADRDSRDGPSTQDGVPTDTLESSQNTGTVPSAHQTIRGPAEDENGIVSMQPKDGEALSRNSEPPHEIRAVETGSTSAPAPRNALISSESAVDKPAAEQEDGDATTKDPVIPTESLVDRGGVATAPAEEQIEAASPQKNPDDKLPTTQNGLGSDSSTTENITAPSVAEGGDVAVPVHRAEGPRNEPTDSSNPINISTESLDDGLVEVSKEHDDGDIFTTPRQPPDESDSATQPFENVPTSATTTLLSYAQVAKTPPHVDHTSRPTLGSPQSSYDFVTSTPDASTSVSTSTEPPSDKSTEKADESSYDFVSPDTSTTADRTGNLSTPTRLPSDKSAEKADGASTSISDVLAGDTGGQPSDLVMPSHPLSLDERSPAALDV